MLFNNNADSDKRGQVGIGTLIVFIAMVLVAAIAAGVLVNTAGFLQETAEQTGAESQAQVSDRLQVISAYGTFLSGTADDDSSNDNVETLNVMVKKSAGSDAITFDSASYVLITEREAGSVVARGTLAATDPAASVSDLTGAAVTVVAENDERAVIALDLTATVDNTGTTASSILAAGDEFTLELVTESGAKTTVMGTVPTSAQEEETIFF